MGVGAGLYMCDVVKKFTFAISSPDEFLSAFCDGTSIVASVVITHQRSSTDDHRQFTTLSVQLCLQQYYNYIDTTMGACRTASCGSSGTAETCPQSVCPVLSVCNVGELHPDPSSRLATIDMGQKVGRGLLCPFWAAEAGSPSNTISPGPRLYLHTKWHFDPSNRLATIHQRYRQDRKTGQDNGPVAYRANRYL